MGVDIGPILAVVADPMSHGAALPAWRTLALRNPMSDNLPGYPRHYGLPAIQVANLSAHQSNPPPNMSAAAKVAKMPTSRPNGTCSGPRTLSTLPRASTSYTLCRFRSTTLSPPQSIPTMPP